MTAPFDSGLQLERTSLAWSRTSLALALAGAIVTRLTVDRLGAVAVILGFVAVATATATATIAGVRYRRATVALSHGGTLPTNGTMMACASASALAAGVAAAIFVVWGMLGA